MHCAR